jgi:uncharacterized membrane protein YdjX (TVP38/TMEM64 family)
VDKKALKRWGIMLGCLGVVLAAVCAYFAWESRDAWLPLYVEARTQAEAWLKSVSPLAFFSLMALIPVVPVPMSIFYLSCGIFPPLVGLVGILVAIPLNFAITYWLSKTFMRPLAERLLAKANLKIPQPSTRRNGILFSIFIRICGTPYTLQNYIIPLAGVSFRDYMVFGLPFQYIPAIAMMFLGNSILKGEGRKAVMAVAVLVAVAIATKFAKDYFERKRAAQAPASTPSINA